MKALFFIIIVIIFTPSVYDKTQNNVNDVDWQMMEDILRAYLCKGNESWIQSLKMHGSPKYLQILVSLQNIMFCDRLPINLMKSDTKT